MRLLHLSDLHVTEPGETLETVWTGPRSALDAEGPFDAIVVSGDLTQKASASEYAALSAFADSHLLPLLREESRSRARVILVPGNHDVDWSVECLTPIKPDGFLDRLRNKETRFRKAFQSVRNAGGASGYRITLDQKGTFVLLEAQLDDPKYRNRLSCCQSFLANFYDNSRQQVRVFDLLHVGGDWSAHVFAEEKVAVFGFNSCHGNDRAWTAASIDPRAISAAANYRRENCPNFLAVATWHHGFAAETGRPDQLSLETLGRLSDAGFSIGMHGHVHRASAHVVRLLNDRFTVVATGSLGAGSKDRPDAAGRQFSIVDILPTRITTRVFERVGNALEYIENPAHGLRVFRDPERLQVRHTSARTHRRTWTVRSDGIAQVRVEMEDIEGEGRLDLGAIRPPFCQVVYDERAIADDTALDVVRQMKADGRVSFFVADLRGKYRRATWSYAVSNAVVLSKAELTILDPIDAYFANVPSGQDLRCHTVRHTCDRLVLRLEFELDGEAPCLDNVKALVEHRDGDEWIRSRKESERCVVTLAKDGRSAELAVDAPVVGYRYGLLFRPARPGAALTSAGKHFANNLLRLTRQSVGDAEFGRRLALTTRLTLLNLLGLPARDRLTPEVTWMTVVWDPQLRRLVPICGDFRFDAWGTRFSAGNGIAGHAFRVCGLATWTAGIGSRSLIYQEEVEPQSLVPKRSSSAGGNAQSRYDWIVAAPLFVSDAGPAIGVVSFAGKGASSGVSYRLHDLANRLEANRSDSVGLKAGDDLITTLNVAFWGTVSSHAGFDDADRKYVTSVFTRLFGGKLGDFVKEAITKPAR